MNGFLESRRFTYLIIIIITLLGFGLRLHKLEAQSLWVDEIYSVRFISALPAQVFINLIQDKVHPPLYYFGLSSWLHLGHTEFLLRLFSVFWGVLTIPVMFQFGRLVGSWVTGFTAALLLAVSPFHVWYSQEVRMHTMVVFAVTVGGCFLLRLARKDVGLNWVGYLGGMLTAVFSHYFALLVLFSHTVLVALYRKLYPWLWHKFIRRMIFLGILIFAWILLVFLLGDVAGGHGHLSWIPQMRWYEPIWTLVTFSAGQAVESNPLIGYINVSIFLVALTTAGFRRIQINKGKVPNSTVIQNERFGIDALWLWLLLPLLITWFISLEIIPSFDLSLYMDRNLIVVLPALLLLVAWGLTNLLGKRPFLLLSILSLISVTGVLSIYTVYSDASYHRQDWQSVYELAGEVVQENDVLLLSFLAQNGWWYYGDNLPFQLLPTQFDESSFVKQIDEFTEQADSIWLLTSQTNVNPHGFPRERNTYIIHSVDNDPFAVWLESHYPLQVEYFFPGMRLAEYSLHTDPMD